MRVKFDAVVFTAPAAAHFRDRKSLPETATPQDKRQILVGPDLFLLRCRCRCRAFQAFSCGGPVAPLRYPTLNYIIDNCELIFFHANLTAVPFDILRDFHANFTTFHSWPKLWTDGGKHIMGNRVRVLRVKCDLSVMPVHTGKGSAALGDI